MSAFVCKPDPLQSIFLSPPTMELSVRLPSDVFVLPSPLYGAVDTTDAFDTPPAYAASSSSTASASPSSHHSLTAYIQLKVPATASTSYSLASLSAKLVASESLMYNNGGFEQSFPIELTSNPLRHPYAARPTDTDMQKLKVLNLHADHTYPRLEAAYTTFARPSRFRFTKGLQYGG
ncbi:hypothetical protein L1887_62275 [Cichorium endivia]|nr:hypothetical protein L1887_62275 [Cichorium endivia]